MTRLTKSETPAGYRLVKGYGPDDRQFLVRNSDGMWFTFEENLNTHRLDLQSYHIEAVYRP